MRLELDILPTVAVVALLATLTACDGPHGPLTEPFPQLANLLLEPVTPFEQIGTAGAAVNLTPAVRATDRRGLPRPGVTITFDVLTGDGTIANSSAVTDAAGMASVGNWTLGPGSDLQQVHARADGVDGIRFSAYACDACRRLVFMHDGGIYTSSVDGEQNVLLAEGWQPAPSPDGQRIAFTRTEDGRSDVYVMDADGSNITRLTFTGGYDGFREPSWSPDGRSLAVSSGSTYEGSIHVLDIDDGGAPASITNMAATPAWSPDGSRIAFVSLSGDDGYQTIHVMNADGTGVREIVARDPSVINGVAWSPGGERIAFSRCDAGCDVLTVRPDGTSLTRVTNVGTARSPSWSPDGAYITFVTLSHSSYLAGTAAIVPAGGGVPIRFKMSIARPMWLP